MGVSFVVMGLCVDGTGGLLSGRLALVLCRSRRVARGLNVFSGTVFAGPAVRLVAPPKQDRGRRPGRPLGILLSAGRVMSGRSGGEGVDHARDHLLG